MWCWCTVHTRQNRHTARLDLALELVSALVSVAWVWAAVWVAVLFKLSDSDERKAFVGKSCGLLGAGEGLGVGALVERGGVGAGVLNTTR